MTKIIFYFIHLLPPETAHNLTIKLLKLGLISFFVQKFPSPTNLRQIIWNMEFDNPVGLAAGFDKNGEVIEETLKLGFSFVEIGTVTPEPQVGNIKPRLFRLVKDKAIINHLGFNNQGMDRIKKRLILRNNNKFSNPGVVGLNISKNVETKHSTIDYIKCLENLGDYADYIVINISSPNTPGLRDLQKRENLENLIVSIKKIRNKNPSIINKPLLIKISPDITDEQKRDIALTSLAQSLDGIIISNTTTSRPNSLDDNNQNEIGGLSGKPLFLESTILLKEMYNLTGGKITLIGVGGISSGRDVYEKIKAGASLVQLYTGMVFEGPKLINKINLELSDLLYVDGYKNISEVIGIETS